ncbi:endocuticle structural glycoprotein SgAbd-4 [Eupeodes corollae]|uniref:endocuticle structural glycoprotein SgAbd-4 n=1 Tax=Eupeodes corollae TaxID=290404 RepID=UPI002491623E|nr:endocuticle structural glycoprotein SgAbd-4 [Eupeodes corollae]
MKVFIVVVSAILLIACCSAQQHPNTIPRQDEKYDYKEQHRDTTTWIPILKYNKEQSEDGSYKTEYETGNNIQHEETGFLKDFSDLHPNGVLVQHGQYSYESPDGNIVSVQYTADENGFRATGDHIPTAPPIPEEIQKGLDQIYAGIKVQQDRLEERARNDPDFARKLEQRKVANQNGQYVGLLED